MNKIWLICHHAFWFTLIGPLIGLIIILPFIYILSDYSTHILSELVHEWPAVMLLTYICGGGPALLTGIISACLPKPYSGTIYIGILGALLSLVFPLLILVSNISMSSEVFLYYPIAGLVSAVIMQQIISLLPMPLFNYSNDKQS